MVASSFWDMRLSVACAATDAEYQNRIILHDNTLGSNSPSWHGSPIPTPTMRRTRRRAALPALKDLECQSPGVQELGSSMKPLAQLAS